MKKPVIVALCCLLALGTATAAFAEEPTPTPAPELVELSSEDTAPSSSTAYRMAQPLPT